MEKIKLFEARDFSKDFEVTVNFVKQNFGPIAKNLAFLVPFVLLGSYLQLKAAEDLLSGTKSTIILVGIFNAILNLVSTTFVVCYLIKYSQSRTANIDTNEVWGMLKEFILPVFLCGLLYTLCLMAGLLLLIIPGIAILVYLIFFQYTLIAEKTSYTGALSRSYQLVKENWWPTFGFVFVLGIIIFIVQLVFSIPSFIIGVGSALRLGNQSSDIALYFADLVSRVGSLFLSPILSIGLGVMYFSRRCVVDGCDVEADIDSIGRPEEHVKNEDTLY